MLALGREQQVSTADGRQWTLGRLELRHIRAWRDWIRGQLGDPFARLFALAERMEDDTLRGMLDEANETRRQLEGFSLGCPLAQRYLQTEEGSAQLVLQLLRPAHPTATEEDAFAVAQALATGLGEALQTAGGSVPNGGTPA